MKSEELISQISEVILQLLQEGTRHRIEDWALMNPIEFGVLSWTIGAFYWSQQS